jgi:Holliday junction resolvase RusA-like endonuclease
VIYIYLDSLPPSSNTAYYNNPKAGRVLTKSGKKYKLDVVQHIVKNHAHQTQELEKNSSIGALIAYGFPNLLNKNFPDKSKERFKRVDVNNRSKLLIDAVKEATAIDDSQICYDFEYKYHSEKEETHIWVWNEDKNNVGGQILRAFAQIAGLAG